MMIQNYTKQIAQIYNPISLSGYRDYDIDLLQVITSQVDLISLDAMDAILPILKNLMANLKITLTNYQSKKESLS